MLPNTLIAQDIEEPEGQNRQLVQAYRVIRDTFETKKLKQLYKNKCQVCGKTIHLGDKDYSEGHHIRPLGGNHRGPDSVKNIIILCPNHHVEFDYGSIAIDPQTITMVHIDPNYRFYGQKLTLATEHELENKYIVYHFEKIFLGNR